MGVELPITDTGIVKAGVAGDVVHRILGRDVRPAFSDDYCQFGFEVELLRDCRTNQRGTMGQQRFSETLENDRVLADLATCLLGVSHVVDTYADNLSGRGNHWVEAYLIQRVIAGCIGGQQLGLGELIRVGNQAGQVRYARQMLGEVHNAIPNDGTEAGLAVELV
ncbi:hypothetical protein D9M68_343300 [compost metagenome]